MTKLLVCIFLLWIPDILSGAAAQKSRNAGNRFAAEEFPDRFLTDCQNYPFPQNVTYPYGIMPSGRNHVDAQESYLAWKQHYVTSDGACGYRRVLFDDMSSTYSEGIGYGMLLSVNFDDQALFNDLWGYYHHHMNSGGFMEWWIGSDCQILGYGGATDADEDAAYALLLADRQWGSNGLLNYRQLAIVQINRIFSYEVESGTFVLKPGNGWGGSEITNPSYFSPAYYRAFREATNNSGWNHVIDKCYEILNNCLNTSTGLVPDWCQANGQPSFRPYYYYYDATRTPWRIALDYLWAGDERARSFCERVSSFIRRDGVSHIREGYFLDGSPIGWRHINVFVGPFAVGSMATRASFQAFCDSAYRDNVMTVPHGVWRNYYDWSQRTITLFIQTGNFLNILQHPVPIQLSYFQGALMNSSRFVRLRWGTASEVDNYGFEIQKRSSSSGMFTSLPNVFIPGHGTTSTSHNYSFIDTNTSAGSWLYRLKQIDLDGSEHFTEAIHIDVTTSVADNGVHDGYSLSQNYPNPWNPSTTISFQLPTESQVTLSIYNVVGQLVAQPLHVAKAAGHHTLTLHSDQFASGVYYYTLRAGDFVATRRFIVLQ